MSATSSRAGGLTTRQALLLGGGLAGAAGLVLAAPAVLGFDVVPPCPFRSITGLDCPFCGGTRATRALLTGDVAAAADHNLIVPLAALVLLGLGMWWLLARRLPGVSVAPVRRVLGSRAFWVGLGVAITVFWVVRNLPAFGYLASPLSG